ncbi:MAG: DUF1553 domain-containing protein [Verrucomicrobiales bacterium]
MAALWMQAFGRNLVATRAISECRRRPQNVPTPSCWPGWYQISCAAAGARSGDCACSCRRTPTGSDRSAAGLDQIDTENALLGRADLRRLEAEAIRDAILAVSGGIDLALGEQVILRVGEQ